jgi:hypothetical protein
MDMKRIFACVVGVAALAAVVAPVAEANCSGPKVFQSVGNAMATPAQIQVRWAPPGGFGNVQASDTSVIGRWWQADAANLHNNFDGNCPAVRPGNAAGTWWFLGGMAGSEGWGIDGGMTAVGCAHNGCPTGQTIVLVEDLGTKDTFNGGPDGVPDTAYFVALSVNETPAGVRNFDYARTNQLVAETIMDVFMEFPKVDVTMSGRNGLSVDVTLDLQDAGLNFQGTDNGANTPIPASSTILSYDLMKAQAMSDPGRGRGSWTEIDSIPYMNAGVDGAFRSIACDDTASDAWLAVGITFVGNIPSSYVGEAIALQCDPALADPQGRQLLDREVPSERKTDDKPSRTRGSRGR